MQIKYYNHRQPNVYNRRRPPARPKKGYGQYIDPARFVKAAMPLESKDYVASHSFTDFAMHPLLKSNVAVKGYITPSEIQDKTIALGLEGKDVVGIANTGTGKTAAFMLPILNRLMHEPRSRALIMTPTRELAAQIEGQAAIYAKNTSIRGALLIGGAPIGRQTRDLKDGARLVIGTPGRIKDHMRGNHFPVEQFNIVVLDEVDRMLDMGFINDMRTILGELNRERQSFFFSATLGGEVSALIQGFTNNPVTVDVKVGDTSGNVNQDIINYSNPKQRIDQLHDVLIRSSMGKALVFGETKRGVERLSRELESRGFKVAALHGGKSQGQRKRALDSFRESRSTVLVATDVAARGIDVVDITHVINYDVPYTYNDYIHRIGRAGRAGKTGQAFTFVEKAA